MIDFLKKHTERVTLLGVGLAFLLFVGGGIYLQKKNQHEKESSHENVPKTVELLKTQSESQGNADNTAPKSSSYFLKPSPGELLDQLGAMESYNEEVTRAKFVGFRVMWPVYFFAVMDIQENMATVLFDVSEDGFGVEVQSEVDTTVSPEILLLEAGTQIWIAGEIVAVDLTGTGTVFIQTEHLRFSEDGGLPPVLTDNSLEQ